MLLSQTRSPSQIIGELLAGHPEAASLQGEASHTTEAWLGMVRTRARSLGDDERLVRETVTLAIALLEDSRPQLQSLAAR